MNHAGEYYLTGVMETAAGFNLHEDQTFEFFFTYGALDRHAYGTWQEAGANEISFNTNYKDQSPFTILLEEKREVPGMQITIPGFNEMLLKESVVKVISNGVEEEAAADENNQFIFKTTFADKIIVTCFYYFDNPAVLIPKDQSNNYFEVQPNQNLLLIHFNELLFTIDSEGISGKLPMFDDEKMLRFIKQ